MEEFVNVSGSEDTSRESGTSGEKNNKKSETNNTKSKRKYHKYSKRKRAAEKAEKIGNNSESDVKNTFDSDKERNADGAKADSVIKDLDYIENSALDDYNAGTSDIDGCTADINTEYEVIGVTFKKIGKIYYFDVDGNTFQRDDHVIVETARGLEYGTVVYPNRVVSGAEIVLPLRKVIRVATNEDEQHHHENLKLEIEAFNACVEKIALHNLDMKLVDAEYTFDNTKLIFYFTSEERVDFRDLVKDLASIFRTRIELRQIGIRDEAKLMGGLGICGRPFCCHSFLSDFVQVSIKMAKEQNLSLNSSKISGACGRLMCCLRYEYDTYSEEIKKTPKIDSVVSTPEGDGIVKETVPLAGMVKVELRNNNDTLLKVFSRDEVNVIKGKTVKEFLAEISEKSEKDEKRINGEKDNKVELRESYEKNDGTREKKEKKESIASITKKSNKDYSEKAQIQDEQPSKINTSKRQASVSKVQSSTNVQSSKKKQSKSVFSRLRSEEAQQQKEQIPKCRSEGNQSLKFYPAAASGFEKSNLDAEYGDFELYEETVKTSRSGKLVRRKKGANSKKSSGNLKRQNQKKN